MADSSGSQEIPDSQATYFESSPNDQDLNQVSSGAVLSESQDFQLIDTSNTEDYASEPPLNILNDDDDNCTEENGNEQSDSVKVNLSDDELLIGLGNDGKNDKLVADCKEQLKHCLEDDIDDTLINDSESSLQDCGSSQFSRASCYQQDKQIRTDSLKRKASANDHQGAKYMRTFSGNDALSIERHKDEEDSQRNNDSNVIEETEEIPDSQTQNGCHKTKSVLFESESIKFQETNADEKLDESSTLFQSDLTCYKKNALDSNTDPNELAENEVEANLQKMFGSDGKEPSLMDKTLTKSQENTVDSDYEVERKLEALFDNADGEAHEDIRVNRLSTMNECDVINSLTAEEKSEQEMSPQTDIMKELLSNPDRESEISEVTSTNSEWKLTSTVNGTETKDSSTVEDSPTGKDMKSRKSIEVIFDKSMVKSKPREIVEIDDSGEKIILDSSQEDNNSKVTDRADISDSETVYKSCMDKTNSTGSFKSLKNSQESVSDTAKLNGSTQNKVSESERTNVSDDNLDVHALLRKLTKNHNTPTSEKSTVVTVSDSDNSLTEDNAKNKYYENTSSHPENIKLSQVEREISFVVRLKCSLSVDESGKDIFHKEVLNAVCEPCTSVQYKHQKTMDSSASGVLADISASDNKESSPASVNSNPVLYHLQPSRLSMLSTVSSSSSASSAVSLAAKNFRDSQFSQPQGPAKHAKKPFNDMSPEDKQAWEIYDKFSKEWKNSSTVVFSILNFLNHEIVAGDCMSSANILVNTETLCSSTPETGIRKKVSKKSTTKSMKEGRVTKHSKNARTSKKALSAALHEQVETDTDILSTPKRSADQNSGVASELEKEFLNKQVFARWSIKPTYYYSGKVINVEDAKLLVEFHDGVKKSMLPEFVIVMKENLEKGLSVYAYSEEEYASSVLIVDVKEVDQETVYTVETDEGIRLDVTIAKISLTADQAKLVREQQGVKTIISSSTPQQSSNINLDNVITSGKRSRKPTTPSLSRTSSRSSSRRLLNESAVTVKPSVSGLQNKPRSNNIGSSEKTSDSNPSSSEEERKPVLGVQEEVTGSLDDQIVKGPPSKVKGKGRGRKKQDTKEDIENLGPVPEINSNIFKGMAFILSCVSLETLEKYQVSQPSNDSESEPGTENEEQWVKRPFVRNRLREQLLSGGGKIYENFEDIPPEEYAITKHITNVPNLTKKALLCLSVGIKTYNHQWVIRSCLENKPVQLADEELPSGWSLEKRAYIDSYQRSKDRPFEHTAVAIPQVAAEEEFSQFWKKICENAGASVQLLENPDDSFVQSTIVLANQKCPSWVLEKANAWQIPVVSTTWVVQCLIEGKLCAPDAKVEYKYSAKES